MNRVLVHLAAGIGDIVLGTPLLLALAEMGLETDLRLDADYPGVPELFTGWSAVRCVFRGPDRPAWGDYWRLLPAVPPFCWQRFEPWYRTAGGVVERPPAALFYRDAQAYFLTFARALGYAAEQDPLPRLPVAPAARFGVTAATVVLAPGCKTGKMAAKRWPHFVALAGRLPDVALAGTPDDLDGHAFPSHVRSFVGKLSLRETAELFASAGAVVANDSGLAHLAAAVGTPVIMLFGPTPSATLGPFPPNVFVLRSNLPCEPCWYTAPLRACQGRVDCLKRLAVDTVLQEIKCA